MLKLNYFAGSCFTPRIVRNEFRKWLHFSVIQTCRICMPAGEETSIKEDTLENSKGLLNNLSDQVWRNLCLEMNLKYHSSVNVYGFWDTVLITEWPERLRAVGMAWRKKESECMAAQILVQKLIEKNVISTSGQLMSKLACSAKPHLSHELTINAIKDDRKISFVGDREVSYNKEKDCLMIKLYQVNDVNNIIVNRKLGIRSLHSLSTTNLLCTGGEVQNSTKMSREYTDSAGALHEKEINLELKGKTTKKYRNSRKEKSKDIEDEETKTTDDLEDKNAVDVTSEDLEIVEGRFPQPTGTLHNLYADVAKQLNNSSYSIENSYRMVPVRSGKATTSSWNCTYKVKWPTAASFSAIMPTKVSARKQAALKVLHWLHAQGKLTRAGALLVYDKSEIKEMKVPVEVTVDASLSQDIDMLIQLYKKDIGPMLDDLETSENQNKLMNSDEFGERTAKEMFGTEEATNPITGFYKEDYSVTSLNQRNMKLYNRYRERISSSKSPLYEGEGKIIMKQSSLPIAKYREQILSMVEENPVIVVKGEPGCGKSTQVPQYIMQHWEAAKQGAHCNIIVTQPRRISAISLAERVASERQEMVGDVVGYQVRLKAELPRRPGGAILYCSTGILLRRLQSNPGLHGASHIILDEAHERDINTDVLLVLLRRALALNPDLRVIVMSATINADLFQKYFDDAPVLHVPGFTYPVKSFFIDDLNIPGVHMKPNTSHTPVIDSRQVANLIQWVDRNRPEGAILCFLPGWGEILAVAKHLDTGGPRLVLPVHSRLTHKEQNRIFHAPPPGVRKIILATNIAETSITINDVMYVIDTGAHKEQRLNVHLGVESLDNHWVSQANVNQRRGRAGRVQPGECYHMYTRKTYDNFTKFPIPELLRVPLEKTVLDCKTYSQDEKAAEFLSQMPEPPPTDSVTQAVVELFNLGALDEDEKLTPLGKRIAMFTTHPKLSKALVYSAIFRCVSPMVTIVTVLSSDSELFKGGLSLKEEIRCTKKTFHPSSDHVSLAWLYQEWQKLYEESAEDLLNFCSRKGLNSDNMYLVSRLRALSSEHLSKSQMLDVEKHNDLHAVYNRYSGNDELVKAVFLSGTGTLLYRRSWDVNKGRVKKNASVVLTESGQRTTITPESVNYKRKAYPSPFLTYFRQVQSMERRTMVVRETSLLSPLSVLLFSMGKLTMHEYNPPASSEGKWDNHMLLKINRRRDVVMLCEKSQVQRLAELRVILWKLINYFVMKEGVEEDHDRYQTVYSFHEGFLKTLCSILYKAGATIEYDENGNQRE